MLRVSGKKKTEKKSSCKFDLKTTILLVKILFLFSSLRVNSFLRFYTNCVSFISLPTIRVLGKAKHETLCCKFLLMVSQNKTMNNFVYCFLVKLKLQEFL